MRRTADQGGFCGLLVVSERKFDQLLATGVIGQPLELGPRVARWTQSDFEAAIERLPRRHRAAEPATLSNGRRARIERMKNGSST